MVQLLWPILYVDRRTEPLVVMQDADVRLYNVIIIIIIISVGDELTQMSLTRELTHLLWVMSLS